MRTRRPKEVFCRASAHYGNRSREDPINFRTVVITPRLILRPWRPSDLEPFAALNADPAVMEFFPSCLSREESDSLAARIAAHHLAHGFCFFATELAGVSPFIGFIGISNVPFEAAFTPAVEIGWRLARPFWNRGLATEGATAVLNYALNILKLPDVVSFTVPANIRSRRVMEKIGMQHDRAGDFDHPRLPAGDPLRRHMLYRISRNSWTTGAFRTQ